MRALAVLALVAVTAGVSAQTLEERAAEVRRSLAGDAGDVRPAIQSPPPVEQVIDRGTRVIAPTPPAPQPASPASPAVASPTSGKVGVPLSSGVGSSAPGVRTIQLKPGASDSGFVIDPRSAARTGIATDPGAVGLRNFPPGVLVRGTNDGQVSGVSNLSTGSGVSQGFAP